jgi:hypothetical protein
MPAEFDMCRSKGGQIKTKRVNAHQYMHLCFLDGKSYPGEIKEYKKVLKGKSK